MQTNLSLSFLLNFVYSLKGEIAPYPNWLRSIVPWNISLGRLEWERIDRPVYSNAQLLEEVNKIPQLVNNEQYEEAINKSGKSLKRKRLS